MSLSQAMDRLRDAAGEVPEAQRDEVARALLLKFAELLLGDKTLTADERRFVEQVALQLVDGSYRYDEDVGDVEAPLALEFLGALEHRDALVGEGHAPVTAQAALGEVAIALMGALEFFGADTEQAAATVSALLAFRIDKTDTPEDHRVVGLRISTDLLPEWFDAIKEIAGTHGRRMMVVEKPDEWAVNIEVRKDGFDAFNEAMYEAWGAFVAQRKAEGRWEEG